MASITTFVADIKGLTPAVDPRKMGVQQLITGDNVRFTADGVLAGFGDTLLIDNPVADGEGIQSIRMEVRGGDRVIYYSEDSFMEYDETIGDMKNIYVFPEVPAVSYRATAVYLNDYIFMCQPTVGIAWVNILDGTSGILNEAGLPDAPLAITMNNGRLVVITLDVVAWSGLTDGFDWNPELGGAGFTKINEWVPGDAIIVASTPESVIVFTTGGILRGDFTSDSQVYDWNGVETLYRAVNSFCVFTTSSSDIVFLAQQGFFSTKGRDPEPFTPLFNEFLIRETIKYKLLEKANLRVEWDELTQMLYLSVSESDVSAVYDYAYALYKPVDKWAKFSRQHLGILPVTIQTSQRRGNFFGYADTSNRIHVWREEPYVVEPTEITTSYMYRPLVQSPSLLNEAKTRNIMCSTGIGNTIEDSALGFPAGYLTYLAIDQVALNTKDQEAVARIGLFRFEENKYPDELSEISDISVGSVLDVNGAVDITDYNTSPLYAPDYAEAADAVDYGFGSQAFSNFELNLIATNDGRSEYTITAPDLNYYSNAARFYAVQSSGIYHILEFKTGLAGDSFHIQTIKLNGIFAGRLI